MKDFLKKYGEDLEKMTTPVPYTKIEVSIPMMDLEIHHYSYIREQLKLAGIPVESLMATDPTKVYLTSGTLQSRDNVETQCVEFVWRPDDAEAL